MAPSSNDCPETATVWATPGILRAINDILADRGINIDRQVLDTRGPLGYAIYDINRACDEQLLGDLRAVPQTIRVRVPGEARS